MNGPANRLQLAREADFGLGALSVSPSACRVVMGGVETRVEAQTMAVLVVLAKAEGATVTREELIEACWQGRVVSDDAVARTIAKVRSLARGATPAPFSLETLPKVGYRLLPAGGIGGASGDSQQEASIPPSPGRRRSWQPAALAGAGLVVALAAWGASAGGMAATTAAPVRALGIVERPHAGDVADALLTLDKARVQVYLDAGWNPNWHLDSEGTAALHALLLVCERNPTHDKAALVDLTRYLVSIGADPVAKNGWGDTPLVIAQSRKYCGPDHPVVKFLRGLDGSVSTD